MPFAPTSPVPQRPGTVLVPVILPWGWGAGWGYQTYNPWVGFGYSFGGILPAYPTVPMPQVTTTPEPRQSDPVVVLAREYPATLTVQLPTAAQVWLDGKKVSDTTSEEHVLTSPILKQGDQYTFLVKARWTSKGKTYETKRAVTLGPGDRSRLLIVSGDEVKE
jgi:uncharacterized protein (TIGR03000 family)